MNRSRRGILVAALSFLGGIIVGVTLLAGYFSLDLYSQIFGDRSIERRADGVVDAVHILTELRNGKSEELVEQLEQRLDKDILFLAMEAEYVEGTRTDSLVWYALEVADGYRFDHPRTTDDPDLDRAIAHALKERSVP